MKYIKINTNKNNTITEISNEPFSGTTKDGIEYNYLKDYEIQSTTDYNFLKFQPPYYYRVNELNEVVPNDDDVIDNWIFDDFKIYNYINDDNIKEVYYPPTEYDYNLLGLNKNRIFTKGELDRIDYYGNVDSGGTFQDLVLSEYREYYRKDRMVYKRKLDIEWYLEDGTTGATKTTYKYYSPEESIKLGERRRRNVISDLKIASIGLLQQISGLTQIESTMLGLDFLEIVTTEISKYIEGVEQPLKDKVLSCNEDGCEWLDLEIPNTGGITIREHLYSSINIDYSDKIG